MIEVKKIEAGCYEIEKDGVSYKITKDSFLGVWNIYVNDKYLMYKKTKKDCIDFVENGHSVQIFDNISIAPNVKLDTKFKQKDYPDRLWSIDDLVYSTAKGKWVVCAHYYNDSIDSSRNSWDYDDFEDECYEV